MAVDLTTVPWNRLAKLAPPGTNPDDMQEAADRYALNADVYRAASDLWEDKANSIDVTRTDTDGSVTAQVTSIAQDGVSVTYANDPLIANGLSSRIAQAAQCMARARQLRAKSKPTSPQVHDPNYDPFTEHTVGESWYYGYDHVYEPIIEVDEV